MSLSTLSDDALLPILQLLDPVDVFELEQSSRRFAAFVQEQLPKLQRPAELTIVLPELGLEIEIVSASHEEIILWSLERRQGIEHQAERPLIVPATFSYKRFSERISFYFPKNKSAFIRGTSSNNLEFVQKFIQRHGPFDEIAFTELASQPAAPLNEAEFFSLMSSLPENFFRILSVAIPVDVGLGIFQLPQLRPAVVQIYENAIVCLDDKLLQLMPPIHTLVLHPGISRSQISVEFGYERFLEDIVTGRRQSPHIWVFHLPRDEPDDSPMHYRSCHYVITPDLTVTYRPMLRKHSHARLIIKRQGTNDWPQIKFLGSNIFRQTP